MHFQELVFLKSSRSDAPVFSTLGSLRAQARTAIAEFLHEPVPSSLGSGSIELQPKNNLQNLTNSDELGLYPPDSHPPLQLLQAKSKKRLSSEKTTLNFKLVAYLEESKSDALPETSMEVEHGPLVRPFSEGQAGCVRGSVDVCCHAK